jgi:hypothetical protein
MWGSTARSVSVLGALLAALAAGFGCASAQTVAEVKAELEKEVTQLSELQPLEVGTYPEVTLSATSLSYQRPAVRLAASNYPTSPLVSLLSDESPRIRTLALELLFRKQDPQLLPTIYRHVSDSGITFEHAVYSNFRANGPPDSRRASQTVGDFAKAMVNFFGVRGNFDEYWAARKDRSYWYGWLRARMLRIDGQSDPNPGLWDRLRPFREMIAGFPEPDQDLYLIWLQTAYREPAVATEDEVAQAVRRLGRENVLAIADGQPPTRDPDLQFSWDPGMYRYVTEIILNHAQGVLLPEDASRLDLIYRRETQRYKEHHDVRDSGAGPMYVITQARLLPSRASEILHAEIQARSGHNEAYFRTQLTAALFKLRGRAELPFIRDCFFGECGVGAIALLDRTDLPLVNELLDDPRLNRLSPEEISRVCQKFRGIRRTLLLDWFYTRKEDTGPNWNNVDYFLRTVIWGCDHGTFKAILTDDRLPKLSMSSLLPLEQNLLYYKIPREFWTSFTHQKEISRYFAVDSKQELSPEAIPELIGVLRAAAKYVDAQYEQGCRPDIWK